MNQELKKEWVKRLRSGDYKQGKSVLNDGQGNFCCLGVACEIAVEAGIVTKWKPQDYAEIVYGVDDFNYSGALLPDAVREFFGVDDNNPSVPADGFEADRETIPLSGLNDRGITFDQIADAIEANL